MSKFGFWTKIWERNTHEHFLIVMNIDFANCCLRMNWWKEFQSMVKLGYFKDEVVNQNLFFQIMEFLNDKVLKFCVHKLWTVLIFELSLPLLFNVDLLIISFCQYKFFVTGNEIF